MISYIGPNQILFGSDVQMLMAEHALTTRFQFQSVGMYMIESKAVELFRLFNEKREQRAF